MSTFTQWNGPQGCNGPSASDMTKLTDAYIEMKSRLEAHILASANAAGSKVHDVKDLVDDMYNTLDTKISVKASQQDFNELKKTVEGDGTSTNTGLVKQVAAIKDTVENQSTLISGKASQEAVDTVSRTVNGKADQSSLSSTNKKLDDLSEEVAALHTGFSADKDGNFEFNGSIKAPVLDGRIRAHKVIDIVEWQQFPAVYAAINTGSPEIGAQGSYILGCLSFDWEDTDTSFPKHNTKSCRAYIKYLNSAPFDAICDITVTKLAGHEPGNDYRASITVHISKEEGTWSNMTFYVASGTDSNGNEAVYLAVSADNLAKNDAAYSNLTFRACGDNFIPVNADGYIRNNGALHKITSATVSKNVSSITAIDNMHVEQVWAKSYMDQDGNVLFHTEVGKWPDDPYETEYRVLLVGNGKFDDYLFMKRPSMYVETGEKDDEGKPVVEKSYFVTAQDIINVTMPVGVIMRWAPVNSDGSLKNIPPDFLACDGSAVRATDYPDLAKVIEPDSMGFIRLPAEDHSIIKAKFFTIIDQQAQPDYDDIVTFAHLSKKIDIETERAKSRENELDDNITKVSGDLTAETGRATNAEQELGNKITTETARAEGVENMLRADLTAETTRATGKEGELNTAIEAEATRAEGVENMLRADLTTETSTREAEDSKLNTAIEAEKNRAEGAENVLRADLTTETSTREAEDSKLKDSVDKEAERAMSIESGIRTDLTAETGRAQSEEGRIAGLVADENTRATQAELELNTRINNYEDMEDELKGLVTAEQTRAEAVEGVLDGKIDAETVRATAAEQALDNKISTEATRAETAESGIRTDLTAETGRATAAEADIDAKVAAETGRAEAAEHQLDTKVTAEVAAETGRAEAAEHQLDTKVTAEVARAEAAEQALAEDINEESDRAKAAEQKNSSDIADETIRAVDAEQNLNDRITQYHLGE